MRLSKNFTLREFTKSQTATRYGIDNSPTEEHIENIQYVVNTILQPLRDRFGPVIITSGYRSSALNKKIGGAKNSQHSKGEAADIEIIGKSNYDLAKYIESNLEFDQLILEGYNKGDPNSGWVHVSVKKEDNRRETLTATFTSKGVEYSRGLEE